MSASTGITWRELHDYLVSLGCIFNAQRGSHISGRAPTGADIGTCDPNKPGYVSMAHISDIARVFGLNAHDFLVRMGRKPEGRSRMTAKRAQRATRAKQTQRERIPHVDELAQALKSEAERIYRSGPCRDAGPSDRRRLQSLASELHAWRIKCETGAM